LINDTVKDTPADNIKILNIGRFSSYSQYFIRFIHATNPGYMLLYPWNLASYSGGVLKSATYDTQGFLSPGFCPR